MKWFGKKLRDIKVEKNGKSHIKWGNDQGVPELLKDIYPQILEGQQV